MNLHLRDAHDGKWEGWIQMAHKIEKQERRWDSNGFWMITGYAFLAGLAISAAVYVPHALAKLALAQ